MWPTVEEEGRSEKTHNVILERTVVISAKSSPFITDLSKTSEKARLGCYSLVSW